MTTKALALMKGTLDLLIMKVLSFGPMYGYEVSRWIERLTGDAIPADLYPLHYGLENRILARSVEK